MVCCAMAAVRSMRLCSTARCSALFRTVTCNLSSYPRLETLTCVKSHIHCRKGFTKLTQVYSLSTCSQQVNSRPSCEYDKSLLTTTTPHLASTHIPSNNDFYSSYFHVLRRNFSCTARRRKEPVARDDWQKQLTEAGPPLEEIVAEVKEVKKPSLGKDDKPPGDSGEKPPKDFTAKATKYTFLGMSIFFAGLTGYLIVRWGAPPTDEDGVSMHDEFSDLPAWKAHLYRTWREVNYYDKMIKEPSRDRLLPDPLTEPYYQPPYTLVLEMTGVLVHPDWTYKTGWRFKKRPGVDYFLQQVGPPLYEIVVYTSEQGFTAYPILDTLDPNGYIMYRLFRDATRYVGGHHVKDLSFLNRDLAKVIFIDWAEKSFQLQPDNALKLKKWAGNDDDRTLVDLAAFLRMVATSQVEDVRPVLQFYRQYDDPLAAFKSNQKRLQSNCDVTTLQTATIAVRADVTDGQNDEGRTREKPIQSSSGK